MGASSAVERSRVFLGQTLFPDPPPPPQITRAVRWFARASPSSASRSNSSACGPACRSTRYGPRTAAPGWPTQSAAGLRCPDDDVERVPADQLPPRRRAGRAAAGRLVRPVMAICGAAIVTGCAFLVWRASAGHIESPRLRAALAAMVVLLPVVGVETLDNVTNSIWFCCSRASGSCCGARHLRACRRGGGLHLRCRAQQRRDRGLRSPLALAVDRNPRSP